MAGLGPDSRIGRQANGVLATTEELLIAELIDSVNLLIYVLVHEEGAPLPESRKEKFIINPDTPKEEEETGFSTGKEFMQRRAELLKG